MEFKNTRLGMTREVKPPLMNGAGCCKTVEDVQEAARSLAGAIVVGSFTYEARSGNSGNVFWTENGVGLNALGIPNGGLHYLEKNLAEMVSIAHNAQKALIVSIVGFHMAQWTNLAIKALRLGADAVELNWGCPNVLEADGTRKHITSFNIKDMRGLLQPMTDWLGSKAPIWVKLSPYSDPYLRQTVARVLARYPIIKVVTLINTFPEAYALDEYGKSRIGVEFAGLSGTPLKHIGLAHVKQFRAMLPETISIIGVGGIRSGQDLRDYYNAGADACQITTELLKHGHLDCRPFERIVSEYLEF